MMQRVLGLAFLLAAFWSAGEIWTERRQWSRATGTVVGTEHVIEIGRDGTAWLERPIIEFRPAPTAPPVRFRANAWSMWSTYDKGDPVAIRHPPGDPRAASLDSLPRDVIGPSILLLLGIAGLRGRLRSESDLGRTVVARWED